ncbi:UDP-glucosyltransferase 2-like [Macrosteles quadrilineatus]|uniref:UDP-glucosyltransferase 2-like n=1 Tax=Macrosteles quadrilineatus TaxID=74068 RepID=UPI0023E28DB0|nr:UDP-glucosyltransferase 2-like [Macrosteles quadrilineatus]
MHYSWLLVVALYTSGCSSARILVLQPMPARGHLIVTEPLFEELAARGHQLTVVTSFPHKSPVPNLDEIDVSEETEASKWVGNIALEGIRQNMPNQLHSPLYMAKNDYDMCKAVYSNNQVKMLLKSTKKFDMVITEVFTNDCFAPFASKFGAPLVSIVTSFPLPWLSDRVGLPDNPSYIPNYYLDVGSEMTFFERVYNTFFLIYTKLLYHLVFLPKVQNMVDEYFEGLPPIEEIVRNTSLILMNSHLSLTYSRPCTHNVVEVGGIHIKNTSTKVPQDLLDILDKSTSGVVVVSFGSMVRMASLPDNLLKAFLASFAKIPQTVILKYEEELADVPKNVVVRKWLPQREITEHKNVVALLIHGGLASITEAVYYGKPVIGVPIFSDQFLNIKTIVRHGAGVLLNIDDISEQTLDSALRSVLINPEFTLKARQLSAKFRDRPRTALQIAVYWVEYVLDHNGAPQLRPSSVDLRLGQYLLLDIVALVLITSIALVYCVSCILRYHGSSLLFCL